MMFLILYVDDVFIAGKNLMSINVVKKKMRENFEMSECGELKYFLGIKFDINQSEIRITQQTSINKLLTNFQMEECNSVKSPMEKNLQLKIKKDAEPIQSPYRELLGSLMYIMLSVRLDICFPVEYLRRFQQNPSEEHWKRNMLHLVPVYNNNNIFQLQILLQSSV